MRNDELRIEEIVSHADRVAIAQHLGEIPPPKPAPKKITHPAVRIWNDASDPDDPQTWASGEQLERRNEMLQYQRNWELTLGHSIVEPDGASEYWAFKRQQDRAAYYLLTHGATDRAIALVCHLTLAEVAAFRDRYTKR